MTEIIPITKDVIKSLGSLDNLPKTFEKLVYTFVTKWSDSFQEEVEVRIRYYLDKNGKKKTSEGYYKRALGSNGKFEKDSYHVFDGFTFPYGLAEKLKEIYSGKLKNTNLFGYPRETMKCNCSKAPRKITLKSKSVKPTGKYEKIKSNIKAMMEFELSGMTRQDIRNLYKNYDEGLIELTGKVINLACYNNNVDPNDIPFERLTELDGYANDCVFIYGKKKWGKGWDPRVLLGHKVTARKTTRKPSTRRTVTRKTTRKTTKRY